MILYHSTVQKQKCMCSVNKKALAHMNYIDIYLPRNHFIDTTLSGRKLSHEFTKVP